MTDTLIKLKRKKNKFNYDREIEEAFIKACKVLDASLFEPYIKEDQYFEDLDKYRFLASMKKLFNSFIEEGATHAYLQMGNCQMCLKGREVLEFCNNGHFMFAYVIEKENGYIKDIYKCHASTGFVDLDDKVFELDLDDPDLPF